MASKSLADETRLLAEIPRADPVALDMYGLDHSILQNFDEDHPFVHMDIDNDLHNFDDVVGNIDDITKFIQRTASIPDDVGARPPSLSQQASHKSQLPLPEQLLQLPQRGCIPQDNAPPPSEDDHLLLEEFGGLISSLEPSPSAAGPSTSTASAHQAHQPTSSLSPLHCASSISAVPNTTPISAPFTTPLAVPQAQQQAHYSPLPQLQAQSQQAQQQQQKEELAPPPQAHAPLPPPLLSPASALQQQLQQEKQQLTHQLQLLSVDDPRRQAVSERLNSVLIQLLQLLQLQQQVRVTELMKEQQQKEQQQLLLSMLGEQAMPMPGPSSSQLALFPDMAQSAVLPQLQQQAVQQQLLAQQQFLAAGLGCPSSWLAGFGPVPALPQAMWPPVATMPAAAAAAQLDLLSTQQAMLQQAMQQQLMQQQALHQQAMQQQQSLPAQPVASQALANSSRSRRSSKTAKAALPPKPPPAKRRAAASSSIPVPSWQQDSGSMRAGSMPAFDAAAAAAGLPELGSFASPPAPVQLPQAPALPANLSAAGGQGLGRLPASSPQAVGPRQAGPPWALFNRVYNMLLGAPNASLQDKVILVLNNAVQYTEMVSKHLEQGTVPQALRSRLGVPLYACSRQEWGPSLAHTTLAVIDALIAAQQEFGTVPELATVLQACREDCERRLPDQQQQHQGQSGRAEMPAAKGWAGSAAGLPEAAAPGGVEAAGAAETAGSRSAPPLPGHDDGMPPCVPGDGTVLPPARVRGADAGMPPPALRNRFRGSQKAQPLPPAASMWDAVLAEQAGPEAAAAAAAAAAPHLDLELPFGPPAQLAAGHWTLPAAEPLATSHDQLPSPTSLARPAAAAAGARGSDSASEQATPRRPLRPRRSCASSVPRSTASTSSYGHLSASSTISDAADEDFSVAELLEEEEEGYSEEEGGAGGRRGKRRDISLQELQGVYTLKMEDAAEELRVGMTTLKGLCREYGVKRWPQRKLGSLDKLIADMRRKVAGDPSLMAKVQELEAEREAVVQEPDRDINVESKKLRQQNFKDNNSRKDG